MEDHWHEEEEKLEAGRKQELNLPPMCYDTIGEDTIKPHMTEVEVETACARTARSAVRRAPLRAATPPGVPAVWLAGRAARP